MSEVDSFAAASAQTQPAQGGGKVIDIEAGEPVFTKPNVLHWHGAAPDSHAVQFSVYSGTPEWKEAVTDEEYTGRQAR